MEIKMDAVDRAEAEKLLQYIMKLTPKEKERLLWLIEGMKLAKGVEYGKVAN